MELSRKGQYRKKRVCIVYQHCSTSMYACVGVKKEEVKKLKSFCSRPRENFPNTWLDSYLLRILAASKPAIFWWNYDLVQFASKIHFAPKSYKN